MVNKSSALVLCFIPEDVNLVTNFFQLFHEAIPIVGRLVSVGCFERIDKPPGESCRGTSVPVFFIPFFKPCDLFRHRLR